MSKSRKSCTVEPREGGKDAVYKFRRAVNMKLSMEDRNATLRLNLKYKTVSKRRGVDETKSL